MAIIKVDPLREFAGMQDRLNRLFGNVYLRDEDTGFRGSWVPAVDIYETDKHDLVLRAELPGMSRENLEVTVENNTLIIKGEKKFDAEVKEENYRRIERSYGTFTRAFTLPETVDTEHISSELKEGELTVVVPKQPGAQPRKIQIGTGGKS